MPTYMRQLERIALALTLLGDFFVKKIELQRHDSLGAQVFEGGAAGYVERSELLLERRTFGRRKSDFAIFERVPNFARQSEFITQRLQNHLDPRKTARHEQPLNGRFMLAFEESDRVAHFCRNVALECSGKYRPFQRRPV